MSALAEYSGDRDRTLPPDQLAEGPETITHERLFERGGWEEILAVSSLVTYLGQGEGSGWIGPIKDLPLLSSQARELEVPNFTYGKVHVIDPQTEEAASMIRADLYMELRTTYVKKNGWLADTHNTDYDVYDDDPDTRYYVQTVEAGADHAQRIVCGLRLTPVNYVEDSLSWSMLGVQPGLQEEIMTANAPIIAEVNERTNSGGVWDLTRLVPQEDRSLRIGPAAIAKGIHQLIGAAIAETSIKPEKRPLWFFLVTDSFKKFLDSSGIAHEVIYSGRLKPEDKEVSHFCIVDPVDSYLRVSVSNTPSFKRTYEATTDGILNELWTNDKIGL